MLGSIEGEVPTLKRAWPFGEDSTVASLALLESHLEHEPVGYSQRREQICCGSIIDITAQVYGGLSIQQSARGATAQLCSIVSEGDYFALKHDENKIARFNKKVCSVFRDLIKNKDVELRAYVSNKEWMEAFQSRQPQAPHLLPVEINVYASEEGTETVGQVLSRAGFFLQFPYYGSDGTRYFNPHLFNAANAERTFPEAEPLASKTVTKPSGISESIGDAESQGEDSVVVDSILNSLSHHVSLHEVTVDRRIKSSLLSHQREAIDFIFRREKGEIPSELSLWKYNDIDADEPFYQHVFSGAKRPEQDEANSGIIADEMGLGKSLVILSTIAGSLDRANDFASFQAGPSSRHSAAKAPSRATLILAPSSLLIDSWVEEIRKHSYPSGISFHRHLGPNRHREADLLFSQMIVFTTYATVAAEFCRGDSKLANITWFRIVLDEAHNIRNRSTKQFQALASLSARHRWCLTGTPIQNSLEDLGALVSFLKVPILENGPTFRKFIISPTTSGSVSRFQNLRRLLQTICLRRTRELLDLPEPIPQTKRLAFSTSEQVAYDNLFHQCRSDIDKVVSGYRKSRVNNVILEWLLRIRLFCNNGLTKPTRPNDTTIDLEDHDEILAYLEQCDRNCCSYCSESVYTICDKAGTDGAILIPRCLHLVCRNCVPYHRNRKGKCHGCANSDGSIDLGGLVSDGPITRMNSQSTSIEAQLSAQYPTKLRELLSDVRRYHTSKSIVFSSWKKTLELVGELLASSGIKFNMITGSVPLNDRLKVLKDFRAPLGVNILLMTLGTGAEGLNLAIASRIYLLEPQWNPSIESQAIGRALRLGQTEQVTIVRYVMKGSVEESNVLFRQRKKIQLAGGGFRKGHGQSSERLQSLLNLFDVDEPSIVRFQ